MKIDGQTSAGKIRITSKVRNKVSLIGDDPWAKGNPWLDREDCNSKRTAGSRGPGRMPIGGQRGKKSCRNGGNGYKDAISVVWSIAITSVPSFRRGVTWSLGNRNPKTLLQPGDGRASAERRRGMRRQGREKA